MAHKISFEKIAHKISFFKIFTMMHGMSTPTCMPGRENEREGLLPDCRVGVKESESEDDLS